MGYVSRNQDGMGDLTDWEKAIIMGDGPAEPFTPKCLEIKRQHVITFDNDPHGFCGGQVQSWRRQTASIKGTCLEPERDCKSAMSEYVFIKKNILGIVNGVFDPTSTRTVSHICDACQSWPKFGPGADPVSIKYHRDEVERICLESPAQLEAALRQIPLMNESENLDFICLNPTQIITNSYEDLITKIGDCLCTRCAQLGGKEKVDAFLDELVDCTNRIMLPSVPAKTEKEKEAEWEACVRAATDALCRS